jgi:hypothetical protein
MGSSLEGKVRKRFFFEKKEPKNFRLFPYRQRPRPTPDAEAASGKKSFASFLQKRRPSFSFIFQR